MAGESAVSACVLSVPAGGDRKAEEGGGAGAAPRLALLVPGLLLSPAPGGLLRLVPRGRGKDGHRGRSGWSMPLVSRLSCYADALSAPSPSASRPLC